MGMLGTFFGQNPFGALANTAGGLESTASGNANTLFGQSQGLGGELSNYYNQQLQNPQGLGATTLSQMMTQAGQGASGASGTARQGAFDMAARTGNTAALPSTISSANRQGMSNMSNTQNNLAMQNTMQKLNQQQQGAAGLSSLFGRSGLVRFDEVRRERKLSAQHATLCGRTEASSRTERYLQLDESRRRRNGRSPNGGRQRRGHRFQHPRRNVSNA